MKKRILSCVCLALLALTFLRPLCAHAITPLDPAADASLTLYYQKDGKAFADLQVAIFRVAQALPDGTFALVAPFDTYPVNIHDITLQAQWKHTATTLLSCMVADGVSPDRMERTDGEGKAYFDNLQTGLYLVHEQVTEDDTGTYIFDTFMVYVPTPQPDGSFSYHVQARPKCTEFTPKTQYTVTKLWKNSDKRPDSITVDIYKDGVLNQTQTLGTSNNWSYTWRVSASDTGKWTVLERDVPSGYRVTIQEHEGVFSIINTGKKPSDTPQTGDSFAPLPWVLALCISGLLLLILGIYGRRRK